MANTLSSGITHEEYIHSIRRIVSERLNDEESLLTLLSSKLTYGPGQPGLRGICYYDGWDDGHRCEFIEVCAYGEESGIQLVGTTIHELAHSLAGFTAGHGPDWKQVARTLGLVHAEAAGQAYSIEDFDTELWERVRALPLPSDGQPSFDLHRPVEYGQRIAKARPCPLGVGTRGGTSRGRGSGSRLRLFICSCKKPVRVRVASDEFCAECLTCRACYRRVEPTNGA